MMRFPFLICQFYPRMFEKEKLNGARAETSVGGGLVAHGSPCSPRDREWPLPGPAVAKLFTSLACVMTRLPCLFSLGSLCSVTAARDWRLQRSRDWVATKALEAGEACWAGRGQRSQPKCVHSGTATVVAMTTVLVPAVCLRARQGKSQSTTWWVTRLVSFYISVISKISIPKFSL